MFEATAVLVKGSDRIVLTHKLRLVNAMELFTTLVLAHLLADFPLQTNTIAASKTKSMTSLLSHIFIHINVIWALLGFSSEVWPVVLSLGLAHLLVDWLKPRLWRTDPVRAFILDQLAHVGSIAGISALVGYWYIDFPHSALSSTLLYPSLLVSFGFAMMVYVWIWTNSLSSETLEQSPYLRWSKNSLLEIEQRAGFGLICFIGISKFFFLN